MSKFTNGHTSHSMAKTKMYQKWSSMKRRCNNPNTKDYKNYGGRGITVCNEWNSFEPFMEWSLANGYSDELELDRKNNNLGYSPDNCRYVTKKINASNRRSNRYATINGQTKTITQWSIESGVSRKTIQSRLHYGWDDSQLIIKAEKGRNQTFKRGCV